MEFGDELAALDGAPEDVDGLADRVVERRDDDVAQDVRPGVIDGVGKRERLRVEGHEPARFGDRGLDRRDDILHRSE